MLKVYVLRASQFFPPRPGSIVGKCVVCGHNTEAGHPIDFSSNFTAWNLLQEGNCICEYCYELVKNQDYRRKSWIASADGVRFLTRKEVLSALLDPPVPFAAYITKTGKKQGFLHIVNRVNYDRDRYFVAFDDELIYVERPALREMVRIAEMARELGFTKSDLNNPSMKWWKHRELCETILKFKSNPVWRLVVYAV